MTKYSVTHDNNIIEFILVRKKVKNINLRVKPDGTILVSCNDSISIKYVKQFVLSNSFKILKYLNKVNESASVKETKLFVQGETFYYLGKTYTLNLICKDSQNTTIENNQINISTKNPSDAESNKKLLAEWYSVQAFEVFNNSLNRIYPELSAFNIPLPELKVRKMLKRWGSCYIKKNKIIINTKLVQTSQECIDFVILHELIHFIYRYHNKDFYNFLAILRPNWKEINLNLNNSNTVDL